MTDDTIAAVVTPLGIGGLGVVRVSGARALSVGDRVFRSTPPLKDSPSHTLHHGTVLIQDAPADDAVAAVFRSPRSYTGEDVVEFSCHGNPSLLRALLAACVSAGARPAGPGEFTKRAFLNGKMDLAQAEAVAALISARSETARRWSLDQLRGGLSRRINALRDTLLSLLASLEASLDFVDDDLPDLSRDDAAERLERARAQADKLLATAPQGRLFREGLRVVIAGRPNVGKSSLFNALLDHDRAIVADQSGTTRDALEESLLVDGIPFLLTDTAGLHEGREPVESEGIARARKALEKADAVLWVVEAAAPLKEEDRQAARSFARQPVLIVFNKVDRLGSGIDKIALVDQASKLLSMTKGHVFVSAQTGDGIENLRKLLAGLGTSEEAGESAEEPTLIVDRHAALMKEAAAALEEAAGAARRGEPDECLALDLRRALDALDRITGKNASDDLLDEIFSRFCVGK